MTLGQKLIESVISTLCVTQRALRLRVFPGKIRNTQETESKHNAYKVS